jgi:hypothetical protein
VFLFVQYVRLEQLLVHWCRVGMCTVIHVRKNSVHNVIFAVQLLKEHYGFILTRHYYRPKKILLLHYKMTSVVRNFAQRNTNSSQIIPVYEGTTNSGFGPFGDLSGVAYYTLDLPTVQYTGGSYFVDLNGLDASGNLINVSGQYQAGAGYIHNTNFIINVPIEASFVPNLEFTIFFKNIPFNRLGFPAFTVGILSSGSNPIPYTFSPPVPSLVSNNTASPNITFKSDGTRYTAVASGPAGWLGPYLIAFLVNSISPP